MRFDEIMGKYLALCKNPSVHSLSKRILSEFGHLDCQDVRSELIEDYKIKRLDLAKPATVNRELAIIKRIMNLATRWGYTERNPASEVQYCKGVAKRTRWLTESEEQSLLTFSPEWLRNIIIVAINTGLRRGELLNLTWEDINLNDAYIFVKMSKNGDQRCVPINKRVYATLESLRTFSSQSYSQTFSSYPVFTHDGFAIKPRILEYYFTRSAKMARLNDLHFHDLRHTFATRLIQAGVDLYRVQLLLGHRTLAITQRYAHHSLNTLRGAIDMLG